MLRNVLKNPTSSAFKLILGVVLAATSTIASLPTGDRARAQSATSSPELELPKGMPSSSKLRVDGSSSMVVVNKTLKQRYEKQFPGTTVALKAEGTDLALQEVREGQIEVAAIGRSLTAEEKASGLQETPLNREKIAIVVGADNPYRGNMTYQEFVKIFRGEITDWSELGGPPGPIRLIDRPENSDTRQAFRGYTIFQDREFAAGATAEPIVADSTDEMIDKLGNDGIGYAIASQVMERDDVQIVTMHKTLPDDSRYPFSQPRSYVYKGAATPATAAFVGLAGAVGQQSLAGAATVPPTPTRGSINAAIVPATGGAPTTASVPGTATSPIAGAPKTGEVPTTTTPPIAAAPPNPATPEIVAVKPKAAETPETTPSPMETAALPPPGGTEIPGLIGNNSILPDFWWLLPIGLVALLVWWGVRKLRSQPALELPPGDAPTPPIPGSDTASLPPGTAPDVSSLPVDEMIDAGEAIATANVPETRELPTLPIPETNANLSNLGLAGGTLAGGLAASTLGSNGRDELTTPPTAYFSTTSEISETTLESVNIPPILESSDVAATGELPGAETPDAVISPDVGTHLANLGLVGGLATSELGDTEEEAIAPETTSPRLSSETSIAATTSEEANLADLEVIPESGISSEVGTHLANLGLAGGLATSELGDTEEEAIAPETTSPRLSSETSIAATTSEEANLADLEVIPESGISSEVGTHLANLGLVGGLATSELGDTEEEAIALHREELPTEPGTPAEISGTEAIAAASTSENLNLAAAEDQLSTETETPVTAEIPAESSTIALSNVEDPDLTEEAALAGSVVLPGDAVALVGGAAAGAALGAMDDLIEPEGVDEFIPAASGADQFVASTEDEFVPSLNESSADGTPVPVQSRPEFDRPLPDTSDWAAISAVAASTAEMAAAPMGVPVDFELPDDHTQTEVEAAKFDVGQSDLSAESLASVDEGLPDLPDGYGESRIVLVPCNPQWVYAYWDIPNEDREAVRRQGGSQLALRFYDVTDIDIESQVPHSLQQYACEEICRDWYLPVPAGDRDYIVEIGYVANDGRWLSLVRSPAIRVPPLYPSDWQSDRFTTVPWNQELSSGKTVVELGTPQRNFNGSNTVYNSLFAMAQAAEAQRVAGSEFPSGMGLFPSGAGLISGMGMSGLGFSASMPPMRSRKFWLVADAELIVYGATEPDATVSIGGVPIPLEPDGTFRFQMAFRDGTLDYPIMAIAADGQQNRSIHMNFKRETRHRNTNTRDEAEDEVD